jgi:hypothetical protein
VAPDRRHFEFTTGEPFYPIGHNVHSSNDVSDRNCRLLKMQPQDDRGTAAYEDIFRRMAEHGENLAEVWMASWSLDIEWTRRWKHYFGLGRYNLHHAWKLDRILALAEKHNIYLHLVLENHGKASTFCDPEWADNPFNEENGGFLTNCKQFFSRPHAREQYKKKLRYIIARWGYTTRLMGLELWSEIDLTGNTWGDHGNAAFLRAKVSWLEEMTRHIKQIDLGRHLLTAHYSGTFARVQAPIARIRNIDYLALDAYRKHGNIVDLLRRTSQALERYDKPVIVTEFGGSPMGTRLPRLEADLHAGLWSAYMLRHAGTPLLWWFMYIDRKDKYDHYRALARFVGGEDRRNRDLEPDRANVSGPPEFERRVSALTLTNDRSGYAWVYDERAAAEMPDPSDEVTIKNITVLLNGFQAGQYRAELWDTYTGKVVGVRTVTARGGRLSVQLPAFEKDIALKIHQTGSEARTYSR